MFNGILRIMGVLPSMFDRENVLLEPSKSLPKQVGLGIKDGKSGLRVGDTVFPLVEFQKVADNHLEYKFERGASLSLDYKKGNATEYCLKVPSMDIQEKNSIPLCKNPRYELLGANELDKIWDMYNKDNVYYWPGYKMGK